MTEYEEQMMQHFGESWFKIHRSDINSEWFKKLLYWVGYQRQSQTIYPASEDVFRAYKLCPFDKTKVVIVGLDPYIDGSANGLAFGYKDGKKPDNRKKSLDIIFQEMENDVKFGLYLDQDYDLGWLAEQGVFLINTVLTVQRGITKSHASSEIGWQSLTGKSIAYLAIDEMPKVFMLWGNDAQDLFNRVVNHFNISTSRHLILTAKHPAADIYGKDKFGDCHPDYPETFLGCKHFSRANDFLEQRYITPIVW